MATTAGPFQATRPARPSPQQVLYPRAQWYFVAAMAITWLGFSQSYFRVVRTAPLLHHIHGALMGGWIGILAVQPILYQRGRIQLHRTLGRWAVYLWMPAMTVCGLLMDRRMLRTRNVPPFIIDRLAFLDLASLLLFPCLIVLSIAYVKNVQLHARFLVCTVLLLLPPALTRALFLIPFMRSFDRNVDAAFALVVLVLFVLVADDRRRGRIWLPYPLAAVLFVLMTVLSAFARNWAWWHSVAGWVRGTSGSGV